MPKDKKDHSSIDWHSRKSDFSGTLPGSTSFSGIASEARVTASGIVTPPDGGWGWVVVSASFLAHLIADGCSLSFGVLFSELLEAFEESKSKTAWVGSLFISMPLICGPFASMFVSRYGCRWATILGGILASIGCISSAFVNSIDMLCITFGIVSGFGLSLVFIPAVLVVAFYFDQKRSLATGMAVAGSGIGTFIFAPLTELLMEEYSWRGALIIIGGLMLNLVVCGAIFRPLPGLLTDKLVDQDIQRPETAVNNRHVSFLSSSGSLEEEEEEDDDEEEEGEEEETDSQERDPFSFDNGIHTSLWLQIPGPLTQSLIHLPTFVTRNPDETETKMFYFRSRCKRLLSEGHEDSKTHCLKTINLLQQLPFPSKQMISLDSGVPTSTNSFSNRGDLTGAIIGASENLQRRVKCTTVNDPESAVLNTDSFVLTGQLLRLCHSDVFYRHGLLRARFLLARGQFSSCPDVFVNAEQKRSLADRLRYLFSRRLVSVLCKTFDLSIFRNTMFNYFCLHCMLLYMSYNNPYIYIPDKAVRHGLSDELASALVAIMGILSTVGQVVMGFIGDRPKVNTLVFYSVMTSIAGIVTILVPLLTSFSLLALYCAMYGFFISANYALTSIILVDLLGLQQLTSSFGVASSAGGFAVLVGPPLAGWISDQTGSYDSTFYVSGIFILISGCMLFAMPCLSTKLNCAKTKVASCEKIASRTLNYVDSDQCMPPEVTV